MADETFEEYFELVKNDLFSLRVEWRLYRSLFGTNMETVDLLNRVSGPTAKVLERALFESTLLGIRRITDPYKVPKRDDYSVSILGLRERVGKNDKELLRVVNEAEKAAEFARNWSKKKIAHSDLQYRLGELSLDPASRSKVENCLQAVDTVVKLVASKYFSYDLVTHPRPKWNDDRRFLEVLYFGKIFVDQHEGRSEKLEAKKRLAKLEESRDQYSSIPAWLKREDPPLE